MKITDVHRWEKAISLVLKIDGWDLEWVGDKNLPYDAIGTTPKADRTLLSEYYTMEQ